LKKTRGGEEFSGGDNAPAKQNEGKKTTSRKKKGVTYKFEKKIADPLRENIKN